MSERLAHRQFVDFVTTNKKLSNHQIGNRKGHSTETALLHVTDDFLLAIDDFLLAIDKSEVSVVVLLDMSKAFDSIRHDILLQKLQSMDVFIVTCLVVAKVCVLGILLQPLSLLNTELFRVPSWDPCYLLFM